MGRPYAVKGRKKKRKLDDGGASREPPVDEEAAEELPPPEGVEEEEGKEEDVAAAAAAGEVADGLPVVPRPVDGKRRPGAIFVLERTCLEVDKVGKVWGEASPTNLLHLFLALFFRPIRFWLWMYSLDSWISSVLMLILINLFALEDNSAVYFVNELAVLYLNISFCIPDD